MGWEVEVHLHSPCTAAISTKMHLIHDFFETCCERPGWSGLAGCWTLTVYDSTAISPSHHVFLGPLVLVCPLGEEGNSSHRREGSVDLLHSGSGRPPLGRNPTDQSKSLLCAWLGAGSAGVPGAQKEKQQVVHGALCRHHWASSRGSVLEVYIPRYPILKHCHLRKLKVSLKSMWQSIINSKMEINFIPTVLAEVFLYLYRKCV